MLCLSFNSLFPALVFYPCRAVHGVLRCLAMLTEEIEETQLPQVSALPKATLYYTRCSKIFRQFYGEEIGIMRVNWGDPAFIDF